MTIPRDSRSYPYLALAQDLGLDYGHVLSYADALPLLGVVLPNGPEMTAHHSEACRVLSVGDKYAVAEVWLREYSRREESRR